MAVIAVSENKLTSKTKNLKNQQPVHLTLLTLDSTPTLISTQQLGQATNTPPHTLTHNQLLNTQLTS